MAKAKAQDLSPRQSTGFVHELMERSSSGTPSSSSRDGSDSPDTTSPEADTSSNGAKRSRAAPKSQSPEDRPVKDPPKKKGPALRFVTITDPKQVKSRQFKQDVRSQAMTSHMWHKFGSKKDEKEARAKSKSNQTQANRRKRERLDEIEADESSSGHNSDDQMGTMFAVSSTTPAPYLGKGHDVFNVMTAIAEGRVDVTRILHHANRIYATDYFNAVKLRRPATIKLDLLSSLLAANEHSNLVNHRILESKSSIELTSFVLRLLREHIANHESMRNPVTLTIIMKVKAASYVANDDDAAKIHELAMDQIIRSWGGMENLGPLRPYVITYKLLGCILYEQRPPDQHLDFEPRQYQLATTPSTPGSPKPSTICSELTVLGPHLRYFKDLGFQNQIVEAGSEPSGHVDFLPLRESPLFTRFTQALLWNFRHVTNQFLEMRDADEINKPAVTSKYRTTLKQCLAYMQQQPSAADPSSDNPVANDWYFECCRLTFLLYLTALHLEIPFSEANHLLAARCNSVLPTTAFTGALLRTDHNNSWADMSAILLTCVMIIGAATSTIKKTSPIHDQAARKWVMLTYIRTSATLALQPAWAFNGLLRIIVDVQNTLRSTSYDNDGGDG